MGTVETYLRWKKLAGVSASSERWFATAAPIMAHLLDRRGKTLVTLVLAFSKLCGFYGIQSALKLRRRDNLILWLK